ncbi:isocitrate dehydrogenase [NADP] cytoplasmic-like [Rhipicephalus microplus]|uniref:isocitrate dehydrogenase [NADP] cytoplasmic-like n=1 Tax=Rhipicephalus microplus TaxID=6941 RepID=UPI003F6D965C
MGRLQCSSIVEPLGDETSSSIWEQAREKLKPFVETELKVRDLFFSNKNEMDNIAKLQARDALWRFSCGNKRTTIIAVRGVLEKYQMKRMLQFLNSVIRDALGGTLFRKPIISANAQPLLKQWGKTIVVACRAFGDQHLDRSLHTKRVFVLVCKTYYGKIRSWFVAQGFSLIDLMISSLSCPDDLTMFANVAKRTITKQFRCYMTSLEMPMNSMAAMFSWTKGMLRSTKLDNDSRLVDFARMLEKAVAQLFLSRYMSQDIEMCFEGLGTVRRRDYLNTLESIANVAVQMASVYKQVFMEEAIAIIVAFSQHRAAQHVWLICLRFAVSVGNHLIF